MPCPFPEHHKSSGGNGVGAAVAVVLAAIAVASAAGPVVHAAELARIVLTAAAIVVGLALVGGAALVAYRLRHGRAVQALPVSRARMVPRQAAEPLAALRHQAIEAPREVHLHFHGVDAAEVAAIIADVNRAPARRVP